MARRATAAAMKYAVLLLALVLLPLGAAAQHPVAEFPSGQQAQRHCPADTVVSLNLLVRPYQRSPFK
jgi:hypothetical protein